jgi:hypothetical protein
MFTDVVDQVAGRIGITRADELAAPGRPALRAAARDAVDVSSVML